MIRQCFNFSKAMLRPRPGVQLRPQRRPQSDDRSVVKVLNIESDSVLMVDAFSPVGFRLNNGMAIVGPMAIFPRTVLSWKVGSSADINENSLSLFYLLEPKIDILVIGIGDKGCRVDTSIIQFMRTKGINLEVLPTETACTTFNFLNQERRCVAGAFIPPMHISYTEDDLVQAQQQRQTLYQARIDYE